MKAIYFFWGLLPLALFSLAFWAQFKRVFKIHGREYGGEYLVQGLFCLAVLIAAIWFDRGPYEDLIRILLDDRSAIMITAWMIYPAFLLIAGIVVSAFDRRRRAAKKADKPKRTVGKPANF